MNIIVGVDGSEGSQRAIEWCAKYAGALGAKVIAVHAIDIPVYAMRLDVFAPPLYDDADRERILETLRGEWCNTLAEENVPFEAKVVDGYPANVIIEVAHRERADLVVTGRRGLSGFKEMMLGSTSHHLSHHLATPLVIVP
jgi:nucleotide-binding universal stress UspA family protein